MKTVRVVSISLGSRERDYKASMELAGVKFEVTRRGTDGCLSSAAALLKQCASGVDAIGLGGVNLAYRLGCHAYSIREGRLLANMAPQGLVVDGSFVKQFWEPEVIRRLHLAGQLEIAGKTVLISSVLDRYPLAACLQELGANVNIGDALFALKLPVVFPSIAVFTPIALMTMPLLTHMPLKYLYPLGRKQHQRKKGFTGLLKPIQVIAGDFHLINRYLPEDLTRKIIITSTLTARDRAELSNRGVEQIVTLGITLGERSFGANVVEAMICGAARVGAFGVHDQRQVLEILLADTFPHKQQGKSACLDENY